MREIQKFGILSIFALFIFLNGAAQAQDASWKYLDMSNSLLPSNMIRAVKFAQNGTKRTASFNNGLIKVSKDKWTIYNMENSELPSNSVYSLEIDPDGSVWAGTYGGGVVNVDGEK